MQKDPVMPAAHPFYVYVASRASIPERSAMWRRYRKLWVPIISSWIDEAGEGETNDFAELWARIISEIGQSSVLVLYAEEQDFPLKGALIEAGIALGMGKPVYVALPGVALEGRTCRPVGSWIRHPLVRVFDKVTDALNATHRLSIGEKP